MRLKHATYQCLRSVVVYLLYISTTSIYKSYMQHCRMTRPSTMGSTAHFSVSNKLECMYLTYLYTLKLYAFTHENVCLRQVLSILRQTRAHYNVRNDSTT